MDDRAIGLETILDVGPGGHYMDRQHTVDFFRSEHWQPDLWSRDMLQSWLEDGSHIDADIAREKFYDMVVGSPTSTPMMPEAFEQDILQVIDRAAKDL